MANSEMSKELEKLRADVAALSAARKQDAGETQPADPGAAAPLTPAVPPIDSTSSSDFEVDAATEEDEAIRSQLEELGTLLHEEIRDLPTITTLAVFSLGILMGRLMR